MNSSRVVCVTCLPGSGAGIFDLHMAARLSRADIFDLPGQIRMLRGTILRSGDDSSKKPQATKATKVRSKDGDMGAALRSVYQKTVEETIPPEMLDLLGKLN